MALIGFSRSDTSVIGRWWWSIDRWLLFGFLALIAFGFIMAMAATPMVAERIGLDQLYFVKRHFAYIIPSILIMFGVSTLDIKQTKAICLMTLVITLVMVLCALLFGTPVKGARRWIAFAGISIQPSEFVKPAFAVISAWLFSLQYTDGQNIPGNKLSTGLYLFVIALLIMQPDIGMTAVITATWCGQFFLNGLSILFVAGSSIFAILSFIAAYFFLPHVTVRVDKFLDPASGDNYQINKSLEAFANGGALGVGPGEGIVKRHLPDAHADFVFSVLGEEFGSIICIVLVFIFAFIFVRGAIKAMKEKDMFSFLALSGLLIQFCIQSIINMASALHMIPTKGMTLPFVSYGGSSMIAAGLTAGLILVFSKSKSSYE